MDLEPNRPSDRLHNITFRRCKAVNNSGAGFQVRHPGLKLKIPASGVLYGVLTLNSGWRKAFPGNLNGSSLRERRPADSRRTKPRWLDSHTMIDRVDDRVINCLCPHQLP